MNINKFISEENKIKLINRLKSFAWRAGVLLSVMALDFLSQNLGLFNLSPVWVAFISLGISEITKALNSRK